MDKDPGIGSIVGAEASRETRYTMLVTIQEFARERLLE